MDGVGTGRKVKNEDYGSDGGGVWGWHECDVGPMVWGGGGRHTLMCAFLEVSLEQNIYSV